MWPSDGRHFVRKRAAVDEFEVRRFLATDYPRLVAGLTLVCGSRPAAEDAVQEGLARAWERSERGQRIESLTAWVARVSMNLARSGLRRRAAERRARTRLRASEDVGWSSPEDRIDVGRALKMLSRRQREAAVLRYYLGMSVVEVAEALGVTEGTIKTTLFRARSVLAESLATAEDESDGGIVGSDQLVTPRETRNDG
jgi:RNA polymerase sigma-70 factor (ECF subfamily)